jgi:hypothetical protein
MEQEVVKVLSGKHKPLRIDREKQERRYEKNERALGIPGPRR